MFSRIDRSRKFLNANGLEIVSQAPAGLESGAQGG
jgi:hypothetical protein